MGCFNIGERVCNNCVHWQCHSERKIRGNPPKDVYTTSNCDRCNVSKRNTLSKDSCAMFRHIGGMSAPSFGSNPASAPSSGEMVFSSIPNSYKGVCRMSGLTFEKVEGKLCVSAQTYIYVLPTRCMMKKWANERKSK